MEAELSSEVGAAGRLFNGCIDIYWALISRISTLKYKGQQKQALRTEFGRLYFWGDGFYPSEGRLDEILANSSRLKNRVLSIFVEIGETLCNGKTGLYALVSQVLDDKRLRDQRQEVLALTEGIRETLDDAVSSGSEGDSGSDVSDQSNLLPNIIYSLRARIQCLIDLTGSLERPAVDADFENVETAQLAALEVTGPAEIWTRKIVDTFPKIDMSLAQRLGEANWQRYRRVSEKLEQAEPFEEDSVREDEDESTDGGSENDELGDPPDFTVTTKSSAGPTSIFSSIGGKSGTTGTSISGPNFGYVFPRARRQRLAKDLRSQATYTSVFSNDQGERGWLSIPSLPKGADEGKAFQCTVCGDRLKDIIDWTEWKKHVFHDLAPYICTFADCKAKLTPHTTRKSWADHEFSVHRRNKTWICNDCAASFSNKKDMREHALSNHGNMLMQNQLEALVSAAERSMGVAENNKCPFCFETPGLKSRTFAMHVGRHMEEIAMAVLPRDSDFEEDRGSISSNLSIPVDDLDQRKSQPGDIETGKMGSMKGLPPEWKLKRTASGRMHSADPNLTRNQWELEFCHSVIIGLLNERKRLDALPTSSSLIQIQRNLRQNQYSTAAEFRKAVLGLTVPKDKLPIFHQLFQEQWARMDSWLRSYGVNEIKQEPEQVESGYANIDQFEHLAVIGKGAYAKVLLARKKMSLKLYAIKVYKKEYVVDGDQGTYIFTERNIYVTALGHPFIAQLISTFQTDTRLCFQLEYVPGGDLMYHIQNEKFDLDRSR